MRTELKIGITVLLVLSVLVLLYFVFFAGDQNKPKPDSYRIASDANKSARPSASPRTTPRPTVVASRTPSPSPSVSPSPSASALASGSPSASPTGGFDSNTELAVRGTRTADGEPIASARPLPSSPPPTVIPTATPSPLRTPEPNRPVFRIDLSPSPSPTGIADDRLVAPRGPVEANTGGGAGTPAGLLVRKADGKDYYTVRAGDKGLWGVAEKVYGRGNGTKWDLIANANKATLADPGRLQIGQELVIPPLEHAPGRSPTPSPTPGSSTHPAAGKYVIKSGDTLENIAKATYGDRKYLADLLKANPGIDPTHLKIGQEINLPAIGDVVHPSPSGSPTASPSASPSASPRPRPSASPSPTGRGGFD